MKKNSNTKPPSIQWYFKDWRCADKLDRIDLVGLGVWIEIINYSCCMPTPGLFRDAAGVAHTAAEILGSIRGRMDRKKTAWRALVKQKIIERLEGAWYVERVYEDGRISAIRREAGRKGGNPNLLNQNDKQNDKQTGKQTGKQNPTPSTPTPLAPAKTIGIDENSPEPMGLELQKKALGFIEGLERRFTVFGREATTFARIARYFCDQVQLGQLELDIFDRALAWADAAGETAARNPKGLFVAMVKQHTGFTGGGLLLKKAEGG